MADRAEVPHRVNLFDMEMISADVLPLEEVLAQLRTIAPAIYTAKPRPVAAELP